MPGYMYYISHLMFSKYCPFKVIRCDTYRVKIISVYTVPILLSVNLENALKVLKHTWRICQKYLSLKKEYCGFRDVSFTQSYL
jgi:hypothetical protein